VPLNSRQYYGPPVYGSSRNGCTESVGTGVRKQPVHSEGLPARWEMRESGMRKYVYLDSPSREVL
jgi:hypothetical protein